MRKIKKVMLLIVVFMIAVILKGNIAFAEYVIQVVPNATAWKNISVSDAYDECQKLNTTSSTLGTTSLKAHLTTNADWYAVSLLTYSVYGNSNSSQKSNNTTGNSTGIMGLGTRTFTSSIMEGSVTDDRRKSLYDNINTSYVESIKNGTNRESNAPGRGLLSKEYLSSNYGTINYGNGTGSPVMTRSGLFSAWVGSNAGADVYNSSTGEATESVTFRPVIWNK